jgi:GNAT superfamily N-acetyltransferase
VGYLRLELSQANEGHHDVIIGLIEAAAEWLRREKRTNQWAQPWRSEEDRSKRILRDLAAGKTWLLWDGGTLAGTVTTDPEDYPIWPAHRQHEPAVYVRRLVVSRDYAGQRLGAALLDWAGLCSLRGYGAQWVRVDVWRTNHALHTYYRKQGFVFCGFGTDPEYPSGALFEKPTSHISQPAPFRQTKAGGRQ